MDSDRNSDGNRKDSDRRKRQIDLKRPSIEAVKKAGTLQLNFFRQPFGDPEFGGDVLSEENTKYEVVCAYRIDGGLRLSDPESRAFIRTLIRDFGDGVAEHNACVDAKDEGGANHGATEEGA